MPYESPWGRIAVTTGPAAEPVSRADMKAWLRIESGDTADDDLIDDLIAEARVTVENYLQRKLITQTVTQSLDRWPGYRDRLELPEEGRIADYVTGTARWVELLASPVQSITSVNTYDDADNATTWSSSNYRLSDSGERARLVPVGGAVWPNATRDSDAVIITYVAGYGDAGSDVPAAIRLAIKQLVAHWYENREAEVIGTITSEMKVGWRTTLAPYRIMSF